MTADPVGGQVSAGHGVLLLVTITLLLGVFLAGVLLLARSHRRRQDRPGSGPTPIKPDAWTEAGRRKKIHQE